MIEDPNVKSKKSTPSPSPISSTGASKEIPQAASPPPNAQKRLPSEPEKSSPSPLLGKIRKKREGPTSLVFYNRIRDRLKIHQRRQIWFLIAVFLAVSIVLYIVGKGKAQKKEIVMRVDRGIAALMENRPEAARENLDRALEIYSQYHQTYSDWWWSSDALVFTKMLRATQGWRSLGDYEKGIATFQELCRRNTRGLSSWVGREITAGIIEFLDQEHWRESEMQAIYQTLLHSDPSAWGTGERLLVQATGWAGLIVYPLQSRFEKSDFILFGTLSPNESTSDTSFRIKCLQVYKFEAAPGTIPIYVDSTISENSRKRLFWYVHSHQECLLFGNMRDGKMVLAGMEGILLCDDRVLEEFNPLVREWEKQSPTGGTDQQ